ncbi:MAG: Extracellular ribonuclease [Turneriella sp.]|nr:Extracellular ribonuclease [Turneriella sp.]
MRPLKHLLSFLVSTFVFMYCVNITDGYQGTENLNAALSSSCSVNEAYYQGIDTCLTNNAFKSELQKRIRGQRVLRYTESAEPFSAYYTKEFMTLSNAGYPVEKRFDVWDAYVVFAEKAANPVTGCAAGKLYDYYDGQCYTTPSQIMSVSSGGDQNTYNREHSWPKSWFAAGATPVNDPAQGKYCYNGNSEGSSWDSAKNWDFRAFTDLHHLIPSRDSVNTSRSNYSYGVVLANDAGFPSNNGAKFGTPDTGAMPGFIAGSTTAKVFEPPANLKGDIARNYFYIATRYYTEDGCWNSNEAVTRANINTWLENLLRTWHTADPVSQGERDRNDWIERIQGNRNPFIDHPEWVDKISDY